MTKKEGAASDSGCEDLTGLTADRLKIKIADYTSQKRSVLDPRTLVGLNVVFSMVMLISPSVTANVLVFCISSVIMILFKMQRRLWKYTLVFAAAVLIPFFLKSYGAFLSPAIKNALFIISMGVHKFVPFMMVAVVIFNKVDTKNLVSALNKMHLPKGFMLGFAVAIRFLPTIKKETAIISTGMKMRGIGLGVKSAFLHPMQSLEYALVPVLFRAVSLAEDMSAAALVKGAEAAQAPTELFAVKFGKLDAAFALGSVGLVTAAVLFNFDLVITNLIRSFAV
ncbi:energy-coupling factor transporter transmembrane protein EcfT [Treponema sp. OMZ 840]|uniref:energy-coupling factor transporter transmembrane component T n=1 Tax=Treponema sp. OMZ 840 TaxID=244313 RepID=UPI003D8DB977